MNNALADEPVLIWSGKALLDGELSIGVDSAAIVVITAGPGNLHHAELCARFFDNGIGTLTVDLLTDDERQFDSRTRHIRFDVPFLADRIQQVIAWLRHEPATHDLPIFIFATGSSIEAALAAAAHRPKDVAGILTDTTEHHLREWPGTVPIFILDLETGPLGRQTSTAVRIAADWVHAHRRCAGFA